MVEIRELEKKLKEYQEKHNELLKTDKAASSRYGNEFRDIQLRVLEKIISEIEMEIEQQKKGQKE